MSLSLEVQEQAENEKLRTALKQQTALEEKNKMLAARFREVIEAERRRGTQHMNDELYAELEAGLEGDRLRLSSPSPPLRSSASAASTCLELMLITSQVYVNPVPVSVVDSGELLSFFELVLLQVFSIKHFKSR